MSFVASGLRAWAYQRITAIYLAIFFIYLALYFSFTPPISYEAWSTAVSGTFASVAWLLFFFSLLLHSWIGMRDILIDYIHPAMVRITLLIVVGFLQLGIGLWVLQIFWHIGG